MKNFKLLFLLSSFILTNSFGQIKIGDTIKITTDLKTNKKIEFKNISRYLENNEEISNINFSLDYIPVHSILIVKSIENSKVILKPWNFKVYSVNKIKRRNRRFRFLENNLLDNSIKGTLYNNKFFEVDKSVFNISAKKLEDKDFNKLPAKISIGVITLPFKYRPQDDGSFNTEFNINTTINYRIFSFYNYHFHAQLGTGLGSVNLNSTNSGLTGENIQDAPTLGFLTGFMLQFKRIQIGFYAGADKINNQNKLNWDSNGNIWFGFGAGYNLFKNKEESNTKQ